MVGVDASRVNNDLLLPPSNPSRTGHESFRLMESRVSGALRQRSFERASSKNRKNSCESCCWKSNRCGAHRPSVRRKLEGATVEPDLAAKSDRVSSLNASATWPLVLELALMSVMQSLLSTYSTSGLMCRRHCSTEFMKQVFPRFSSPISSGV